MAGMTQQRLKQALDYDPETGVFLWVGGRKGASQGSPAGCLTKAGYRQIVVDGKIYLAHRLAWLWVHGEFPSGPLDHVSRDKADNRIVNLRSATYEENNQNTGLTRRNSSGVKCVYWHAPSSKWVGHIQAKGKRYHIGMFELLEDAAASVAEARARLHGEFHCHG